MTTKGIGHQSFPASLTAERREQALILAKEQKGAKKLPRDAKPNANDAVEARHIPAKLIERLGVAGIPEKVAEKHGESLKNVAADAAAIAGFVKTKLEPWRARSFQRIVDQFYKALGSALDLAPAEARPDVAKTAVRSLSALITSVGTADHLGSSVSAAVALFELGMREAARGALKLGPAALSGAMEEASTAVRKVSDELAHRAGASTALNIFPVLAEQLERTKAELTPDLRRELWTKAQNYLAEAAPLLGFSQATAAELASSLATGLEKNPADLDAAIKEAVKLFRKPYQRSHNDVLRQIDERRIEGITVKSPGRPSFDVFNAALRKTAEAHPAGPEELIRAMFEMRSKAVAVLAKADPEDLNTNPWPAMTALLERFGPTPHAKELLAFLKETIPRANRRDVAKALEKALQADKPALMARGLADVILARAAQNAANHEGLDAALDKIAKLPPEAALSAVLALAPALSNLSEHTKPLVARIVKLAGEGGKDDLFGFLSQTAKRTEEVLGNFGWHEFGGEDPEATKVNIAAAVARASAGAKDIEEPSDKIATILSTVHGELDRANLETLVHAEGTDRPGLWTLVDPTIRYRHDVDDVLTRIMGALSRTPIRRAHPDVQTEAARFALRLTEVVAKLDGDYEIPLKRIEADITKAFKNPGDLEFAFRGKKAAGIRRNDKTTVTEFLNAHREYPLELALTAGVHLTPEQGAWLIERLEKAVARDTKRQLRDFVFACVTKKKTELIEALRTTEAPSKAIARTIAYVARNYREDKANEIKWNTLITGFEKDEDPIGAVEQERIKKTLGELGLEKIAKNELKEEGLAEIATCSVAITYLLEYFKKGHHEDGIDHIRFRKPFLDVLESVARGTWPSVKYDNEAGKRQMAALKPGQQEIWREETVVSEHDKPRKDDNAEQRRAFALAKGLDRALRRDAKLEAPNLGDLGWNKGSLARAEERMTALIDTLRQTEKGSEKHRLLGLEVKAVRDVVVILRLHYAIQGAGEEPKAGLLAIRDALTDAASAIKRQGLDGALQAVQDIGFVAADMKTSPRSGTYAVDEDKLESLLMSTTGGCIQYDGVRRWANCSLAANANEKIIRVYEGDNFVYRAIMRFHEAEIGKYKGPVLWINEANANGNGEEHHKELLLKHALAKATAMGIPLVSSSEDFREVAKAARLKSEHRNVTLKIDGGNTDAIFTDYVIGSDVREERGDNKLWETDLHLNVVMPK